MSRLHKQNKLPSAGARIPVNFPSLAALTVSLFCFVCLVVGCTPSEAGIRRKVQALLEDGSFASVDEIVEIGEPAVEPLLSALEDQSPSIRRDAVVALGRIGDPRAKEALYQAFFIEDFKDQTSTRLLLEALVNLSHPLVVDAAVIALAEGREANTAYEIISTQSHDTKGAFIRLLEHEDADVRGQALKELNKWGFIGSLEPEKIRLVVDILTTDAGWGEGPIWDTVAEILAQMGSSTVDSLAAVLEEDPTNHKAIWYLSEIASPQAALILVEFLDTAPRTMYPDILDALLEISMKAPGVAGSALQTSMDSLISIVTDKSDLSAQYSAAKLLTSLGGPRALEGLLQGLQAYTGEERQTVFIRLLGELGDPGAIDALIPLLNVEDEDIRDDVITALAGIDHPRVVESLEEALKDDERDIRETAAYQLNLLDDRTLTPLLEALWEKDLPRVAEAYLFFIIRGEPGSEEALIDALRIFGTQEMAVDYLNSGHEPLEAAARAWAEENGYLIMQLPTFDSHPTWPSDS